MDGNDIISLFGRSKDYFHRHDHEVGTTFVFFHSTPVPQYNTYEIKSTGWCCMGTEFLSAEGKSWGIRGSLL